MPGDPSRSGRAPVPVPGPLRLALELAIFGAATWALFAARAPSWAYAFAAVVIVHYVLSYDRVAWLLESGGST